MKLHTIHSLEHPIKTSFLEKVYAFVDHEDIDALISEYILESEQQDGIGFWKNFDNAMEAVEDFQRFVNFAIECEEVYAYEE